jgi:hypothetical protein
MQGSFLFYENGNIGIYHLEDIGVDGKIILKWMLGKPD